MIVPYTTTSEQKVAVYTIGAEMGKVGLSSDFVAHAVDLALIFEGAHDLMVLWSQEEDSAHRDEIVADLQEEIDSHKEKPAEPSKRPRIAFDELESVAKKVLDFKKRLRNHVDKWGGVTKLSHATKIPQPSLSRFFNSPSMPRRTTLYRIAEAMNLPESEISLDWVA